MAPITTNQDTNEWQDAARRIAEETRLYGTVTDEDGSLNVDKTAMYVLWQIADFCSKLELTPDLSYLMRVVMDYSRRAKTENERIVADRATAALANVMDIGHRIAAYYHEINIMVYAFGDM